MSKIGAPLSNATFLKPVPWSEKKEYKIYDCVLVFYGDDKYTYIAIRDVPKGKNPTDSANAQYWKAFMPGEEPQ